MTFQSELSEEHERLQKLKANIHVGCMIKFVNQTRKNWQPKIQEIEGPVDHGNDMGDLESHKLYWDVSNCVWTTKEVAFQAHLLRVINEIVNENKVEKYK